MIKMGTEQKRNPERGLVIIVAGSDSDKVHIDQVADSLKKYSVPFEVRICSAHKQPERPKEIIEEYDNFEGPMGYVAIADLTDALSGSLAFHSDKPVIACPPKHPNMSSLNNPPGSSNAYIGDARNVGRFFAQMFSHSDPHYREILAGERNSKVEKLEKADKTFRDQYSGKEECL